jgi:hypothetical protein
VERVGSSPIFDDEADTFGRDAYLPERRHYLLSHMRGATTAASAALIAQRRVNNAT